MKYLVFVVESIKRLCRDCILKKSSIKYFSLLTVANKVKIISGLILGGVPERPKGSDCKSDGSAFGGSNPPPSTIFSGPKRIAGVVQW